MNGLLFLSIFLFSCKTSLSGWSSKTALKSSCYRFCDETNGTGPIPFAHGPQNISVCTRMKDKINRSDYSVTLCSCAPCDIMETCQVWIGVLCGVIALCMVHFVGCMCWFHHDRSRRRPQQDIYM